MVARDIHSVPQNWYCVCENLVEQGECNIVDIFSSFQRQVQIVIGSQFSFTFGSAELPLSIKDLTPPHLEPTGIFVDALPEVRAYISLKERAERE